MPQYSPLNGGVQGEGLLTCSFSLSLNLFSSREPCDIQGAGLLREVGHPQRSRYTYVCIEKRSRTDAGSRFLLKESPPTPHDRCLTQGLCPRARGRPYSLFQVTTTYRRILVYFVTYDYGQVSLEHLLLSRYPHLSTRTKCNEATAVGESSAASLEVTTRLFSS